MIPGTKKETEGKHRAEGKRRANLHLDPCWLSGLFWHTEVVGSMFDIQAPLGIGKAFQDGEKGLLHIRSHESQPLALCWTVWMGDYEYTLQVL